MPQMTATSPKIPGGCCSWNNRVGRLTIYISEEDKVADILVLCPMAAKVMEKYFGREFLKRGDLDRISLGGAIILCHQQIYPLLIELNRVCI